MQGQHCVCRLHHHHHYGARYIGLDISTTMVKLTQDRLKSFGERATVVKTDGSASLPSELAAVAGQVDVFVGTYVLYAALKRPAA